ncbi:MAG: TetR/AcrR family transcriptional regulator [Methanococcoides sp.]|nr:TetR/AcrR family transcriptional regulator [Methanococcoides sp.]
MKSTMNRRDQKKQLFQKTIVDNALKLFLEKGVEETTVAEIMLKSNLGTGTFYNYFQSKEDIIKYVLSQKVIEMKLFLEELTQSTITPSQKITQIILNLGILYDENQQLFNLYISHSPSPTQPLHGPEFKKTVINIIEQGQEEGEFNNTIPVQIIIEMFMGLIQSALASQSQIPLRENLNYKLSLLLEGLKERNYNL